MFVRLSDSQQGLLVDLVNAVQSYANGHGIKSCPPITDRFRGLAQDLGRVRLTLIPDASDPGS